MRRWQLGGIVAALAVAIGVFLTVRGSDGDRVRAPASEAATPSREAVVPPRGGPARAAAGARIKDVIARAARNRAADQAVSVRRDDTLVTINGKPLRGSALLAFPDGGAAPGEQSMSPEMFTYLLERAIDRELTFQAAEAAKLEVSPEQRRALDGLRAKRIDPTTATFDERDAESQMLLSRLAQHAGVPGPYASAADVDTYYRDHIGEFDRLPDDAAQRQRAWRAIELDVRQTLSQDRQESYNAALQQLLAELRAAATISPS